MTANLPPVPAAHPVQPLPEGHPRAIAQCGTCGRWWDDDASTELTPAPAGRCPFEYWHAAVPERPAAPGLPTLIRQATAQTLTLAGREAGTSSATTFVPCPTGLSGWAYVARYTTDTVVVFTEDVWEDLTLGRVVEVALYDVDQWDSAEYPEPLTRHTADNLADAMYYLTRHALADAAR
jgi:hypothetical protein